MSSLVYRVSGNMVSLFRTVIADADLKDDERAAYDMVRGNYFQVSGSDRVRVEYGRDILSKYIYI